MMKGKVEHLNSFLMISCCPRSGFRGHILFSERTWAGQSQINFCSVINHSSQGQSKGVLTIKYDQSTVISSERS